MLAQHLRLLHNKASLKKTAQQSVHPTCGSLRHFRAFLWLQVFAAPKQSPRPPSAGNANRWAFVLQNQVVFLNKSKLIVAVKQ
jgi:predicted KAP-like P-loop ATPase